jgi:predicted transcriptional regulator
LVLEEYDINESKLAIVTELKRILQTYRIYKYIDMKGKCVISEIVENTGAGLSTVYRHIKILNKKGLIEKDFSNERRKNRAHFCIIAKPELKLELNKIERMIDNF